MSGWGGASNAQGQSTNYLDPLLICRIHLHGDWNEVVVCQAEATQEGGAGKTGLATSVGQCWAFYDWSRAGEARSLPESPDIRWEGPYVDGDQWVRV